MRGSRHQNIYILFQEVKTLQSTIPFSVDSAPSMQIARLYSISFVSSGAPRKFVLLHPGLQEDRFSHLLQRLDQEDSWSILTSMSTMSFRKRLIKREDICMRVRSSVLFSSLLPITATSDAITALLIRYILQKRDLSPKPPRLTRL